jgi:hypothetical protein
MGAIEKCIWIDRGCRSGFVDIEGIDVPQFLDIARIEFSWTNYT